MILSLINVSEERFLSDPGSETASRLLNIETQRPGYFRALSEFIHNFRKTHNDELLPTLLAFNRGKLSAQDYQENQLKKYSLRPDPGHLSKF